MRRGFKSWCERAAAEYRRSLGVALGEPLDPRTLAASLGVRVATPEELPMLSPNSRIQLTRAGVDHWSAVTVAQGGKALVILNSGHSPTRQANSLAHELAHVILNHTAAKVQLSSEGFLFRASFDSEQEAEADWLAGCLLAPRDDLLHACRRSRSTETLARHFGISEALTAWRLRMTGVEKQVKSWSGSRSRAR